MIGTMGAHDGWCMCELWDLANGRCCSAGSVRIQGVRPAKLTGIQLPAATVRLWAVPYAVAPARDSDGVFLAIPPFGWHHLLLTSSWPTPTVCDPHPLDRLIDPQDTYPCDC